MMYGWKEIKCSKSAASEGRWVRNAGGRQECPEEAGLPSQEATQSLRKTWSSVNRWMFYGVRWSWRNKGCIVDCAGKIAMTPQERRVGYKMLGRGVGGWGSQRRVMICSVLSASHVLSHLILWGKYQHDRWGNWGTGRLTDLPTIMLMIDSGVWIKTEAFWLQILWAQPLYHTIPLYHTNHKEYHKKTIQKVLWVISQLLFKIHPPQLPN